jgi:hypothetical protein
MAKKSGTIRTVFTDAIFKPKGGIASPAPSKGLNKSK